MTRFLVKLWLALHSKKGQSLVEYALILALVAIVVIAALTALGGEAANKMEQVSGTIGNAGTSALAKGPPRPCGADLSLFIKYDPCSDSVHGRPLSRGLFFCAAGRRRAALNSGSIHPSAERSTSRMA